MNTQTDADDEVADLLIGEVARISGVPIDTLRYYDRAGLLGELPRNGAGRRVFDTSALGLLDIVLRLRRTGMPIEDIRHFVELLRSGDRQRAGRLKLLREHRARAVAQLDQLRADLAVIDWKIAAYQAGEDGTEAPSPPAGWPPPRKPMPDFDAFTQSNRQERS